MVDLLDQYYQGRLKEIEDYLDEKDILKAAGELGRYSEERKTTDNHNSNFQFTETELSLCRKLAYECFRLKEFDIAISLYNSFGLNREVASILEIIAMREKSDTISKLERLRQNVGQ